jgi:hypothetical protein
VYDRQTPNMEKAVKILILCLFYGIFGTEFSFGKSASFKPKLEFNVLTNVPAVEFSGELTGSGKFLMNHTVDKNGAEVVSMESVSIPIKSLTTGIDMRDEHMWDKIFKDKAGLMPNLELVSKSACPIKSGKNICQIKGIISFAGKSSELLAKVVITKSEALIKMDSNFSISLTKMGITPPSYMGVTVEDNVEVKMELESTK